ncbi:15-hydroxyprostaglandin dehydrogenase [NAD(+)]-like [Diabrotica undecimpunctata]|uniref:15-hydroxyprostaglandin dehydrogenase [NAD(+)]-like n=1 Tax=Diabrotica undecimpunctata TaxID=50387 RepID=UPI003B634E57
MVFEIKNKVAIVTGGASGIGLEFVKQFLQCGVRGVVIADINAEAGKKISEELNKEFGVEKVVFVQTDVRDQKSLENAFVTTLNHFKYIDILINNAGVCMENQWETAVDINLKGIIGGMVLGMEKYLRYHKEGDEAVILNLSSLSVTENLCIMPVYVATKYGVIGLTRNWGDSSHYNRTKVRVLAICPGMTDTCFLENLRHRLLNEEYTAMYDEVVSKFEVFLQPADHVAKVSMSLLEHAPSGSAWIIEGSEAPYELKHLDKSVFKDNLLKIDT